MSKKLLLGILIFLGSPSFSQTGILPTTASFFENGVNSPWAIGIDYEVGFAKIMAFNFQLIGGINSQVNEISTFGDVFFGEIQIAPRLYMNKIDTFQGLFLSIPIRIGLYNIPFRTQSSKLILSRSSILQYGVGIYIGYRWTAPLVKDMENLPFWMVLEPFLGWTWDFFSPSGSVPVLAQSPNNIHRFTVGFTFKIGFYTHKKSKATLEALSNQQANLTNTTPETEEIK